MKNIYIISNDSHFQKMFLKSTNNIVTPINIKEVKRIEKESIVLHLSDFNTLSLDKVIANNLNGKLFLRANIIFDQVFIGPLSNQNSACLECLELYNKNNNKESDFLLFKDIKTPIDHQNISYRKITELIDLIIEGWESFLNQLIILSPKITKRISLVQHYQCTTCSHLKSNSAINAKVKYSNNKKKSKDIYRTKEKFNVNNFYKFTDKNFGFFHHQYREYISNYAPLNCVEVNVDDSYEAGWGRTYTVYESTVSAYLEALERYANSYNRRYNRLLTKSYEEIKSIAVDPKIFTLHNDEYRDNSYKFNNYTEKLEIDWIYGQNLITKEQVLIPSQMVFYRDLTKKDREKRFVYETSNGCALGSSSEEAIFYGILEIIERDSFLTSWYLKEKVTRISENSLPKRIQEIIKKLNENKQNLYLYDITKELGIPVVWALFIDENKNAKVKTFSAAGCHLDPYKAIEAAVFEVITSVPTFVRSLDNQEIKEKMEMMQTDYSLIQDIDDHIIYHAYDEYQSKLEFLLNDNPIMDIEEIYKKDIKEKFNQEMLTLDLKILLDLVKTNYSDVFAVNLTDKVLQNFELEAYKVLIPGLLNMSFGHSHRRVNINRLKKYGRKIGIDPDNITLETINQIPHPFP
ncbi:YcaO-like family protein [Dolosigranulum pigrum]|uniref:YcaO-like family protein n=1 Tax=Dolosigranulum pigrum TaxID=29394 RepID=UPI001FCB6068|nr:YcaO-like family protein [Dolosigranulum pigrum]